MKRLLETYSGILPGLVVLFYTIGYVYLRAYYTQFGINIEFYISLTDILFYAIKFLVFLAFIFFILNTIVFLVAYASSSYYFTKKLKKYLSEKSASKEVIERFVSMKVTKHLFIFYPLALLLFTAILIWITGEILFPFTYYIFSMFSFFYSVIPEKSASEKSFEIGKLRDRDYGTLFLIFIVIILHYFTGFRTAEQVKVGDYYFTKPTVCEFVYKNIDYSTDKGTNMMFVGETTDYLFVYSSCEQKTLAFEKGSIENLKFDIDENISEHSVKYYFPITEMLRELVKM